MKKSVNNSKLLILFAIIISCFSEGCEKEIINPKLEPLVAERKDSDGGKWKTFLIGDVSNWQIPEPLEIVSPEFKKELLEIIEIQNNATAQKLDSLNWWSAGAIFRWHEIARELAARYNLPPKNNPDGTYQVPDATKPCNFPKFPFANPPYTARMFAYLSVAQYDALVIGWHYKFKFQRMGAYTYDSKVKILRPLTDFPAYPSEDAIIAGASVEILKAMFPCELEYLEQKASEHLNSVLLGGQYIRSDIQTGLLLGRQVAKIALEKSKNDGMRNAGNQQLVPSLIEKAKSRGLKVEWVSQDNPSRPGMLPGFGLLETWNFDKSRIPSIRPPEPPLIGSQIYFRDLEELLGYSKKLTREQHRIANLWSDGPGSYTPPGHWNKIAADFSREKKLSEIRTARVLALTSTAVADAGITCWEAKYYYMYPRPFQMDARIKTVVGLPNFPSYTSGHSTFSGAAATVLAYLFPEKTSQLNDLAKQASESRIYGGIHFRFDCEEGLNAGIKVGKFAIERGKLDGSPQ